MNPQQEYDMLQKLVLVGPQNAGKTSLLQRITNNKFDADYICTIGVDFVLKYLEIDNVKIKVQIWDQVGAERFRSIAYSSYYKRACGIFLTFDLTSKDSFSDVQKIYQDSMANIPVGVPVILVGCKSDLVKKRVIKNDIAKALAKDLGLPYIETSAKENSNCFEALEELSRLAISYVKQNEEVLPQPYLKKNLTQQQQSTSWKLTNC